MKLRFILSLIILSFISCEKEEVKNRLNTQESYIEQFIESQVNADSTRYSVSNKGAYRVVLAKGKGEELTSNGTVSFYYAGYLLTGKTLNESTMFATNRKEIAETADWDTADVEKFAIKTITLSEAGLIDGLKKGLVGVMGGEECYILFSGKYGFGDKQLGTIPANSGLVYHIWVESISNE